MPANFEIDDEILKEIPEGRFLIAVCQAIVDLEIVMLDRVILQKRHRIDNKQEATAWVAPTVETFPGTGPMGKFTATYRASVHVVAPSGSQALTLGWHLRARHMIAQRFSGMTSTTSRIEYLGDCFTVRTLAGFKLEESQADAYLDDSSFVIEGDYRG